MNIQAVCCENGPWGICLEDRTCFSSAQQMVTKSGKSPASSVLTLKFLATAHSASTISRMEALPLSLPLSPR